MKYIIELEDEPMIANSFHQEVDELWKAKGFNSLVFDQNGIKKLTPYTEPDRNAIEDEVWEFCMNTDWSWIYEVGIKPLKKYSYQEAKAKYEEWKKEKDEIRVGDEVEQISSNGKPVGYECVVTKIVGDKILKGISKKGDVVSCSSQVKKWWRKTGRHFDEVEELLKKMRGEV